MPLIDANHTRLWIEQQLRQTDDACHRVLQIVGNGVREGVQFSIALLQLGRITE